MLGRGRTYRSMLAIAVFGFLVASQGTVVADSAESPTNDAVIDPSHMGSTETPPEGEHADRGSIVRGVAQAHSISEEAADVLIDVEQDLLSVREAMKDRFPVTYAGSWIRDREDGGHIVVAFTSSDDAHAGEARKVSRYPDRLEVELASTTWRDKVALHDRIVQDFEQLRTEFDVTGVSIRDDEDSVVVLVEDPTDSLQRSLDDRYGVGVATVGRQLAPEYDGHPPSALACETLYTSCNPLRGAILLEGTGCSMGFNARRNSDNARVVTTAGHCASVSVSHSGSVVGAFLDEQHGGLADAQIHRVASHWTTQPYVIRDAASQAVQIQWVYRAHNLYNVTVCASGRRTGPFGAIANCGVVTDGHWSGSSTDGTSYTHQFIYNRAQPPAEGGDSGGPIFNVDPAYGMHWGSAGNSSWGSYLTFVEQSLGITISEF